MVSILGMCLISYDPAKAKPSLSTAKVHGAHGAHGAHSAHSGGGMHGAAMPEGMSSALAGDLLAVMSAAASGVSSTRIVQPQASRTAIHAPAALVSRFTWCSCASVCRTRRISTCLPYLG